LPELEGADVMVIHAALLVAVQAQPAAAVTAAVPLPPPFGTLVVEATTP
jgi:hypothetical protein